MDKVTTKLTIETDDGRPASFPSLVVKPTGQRFVFYTKQFTSGRTSDSRVTFTAPFTVNVEAGSGTLNGSPISWSATTRSVNHNTFDIVYVNAAGNIVITDTWDMVSISSAVVLAYVYVGNSAITRLEEVEKTGLYIYAQKQISVGSTWQWTDQEYLVNTGEQPRAFYNQSSDLIYLQYKKDSSVYLRIFDPSDELSWRYIPNTFIQDPNIIHLNRDPQSSMVFSGGSAQASTNIIQNTDLFPLSESGFGFVSSIPYIYLPYLTGSNLQYLNYSYTIEIGHLSSGSFVIEASVDFTNNNPYEEDRWLLWAGTLGLKYLRLKCTSSLMGDVYYTPVSGYAQVTVWAPFELRGTVGNTINSTISHDQSHFQGGSANNSRLDKTFEYDASYDTEIDSMMFSGGSSRQGRVDKTFEYDQSFDTESDSMVFGGGSTRAGVMTLTNA